MAELGIRHVSLGGDPIDDYWVCSEAAAGRLLEARATDSAAFDLLAEITSDTLLRGRPLNSSLSLFAAEIVLSQHPYLASVGAERGLLPAKRPTSPRRSKTRMRTLMLYGLAKVVEGKFSLPLTRNDASAPKSACDAVVAGLARHGYHVSYRAVKEICVGSKAEAIRTRSEIKELRRLGDVLNKH